MVFSMACIGLTNAEIAARLGICVRTVKVYVRNVRAILDVPKGKSIAQFELTRLYREGRLG